MNRPLTSLAILALAFGCGEGTTNEHPAPPPPADGPRALPPLEDGKADNYISTTAREFVLTGQAHLTLPEGFESLPAEDASAKLDALVQQRLGVVESALKRHLDGILREANDGASGEDARYFTYFRRNRAGEAEPAEVVEGGRARFDFSIQLVGSVYLMSKVAPGDATHRTFELEVRDWRETEGEQVTVEIAGSESRDAFPKFDALFADGVYDMAVHFGGDYNEERFDLETARWLVEYLLDAGFESEVTRFEALAIDSPPFTKKISVGGRPVEVRVYVYHSDMVTGDREAELTQAMEQSFAKRDVVIYSGHAGEGAGFILDYQPRHEIRAADFATLPLAEKYQIYIFDGCRTYRTYVDDLMDNPAKTFENLDIVTTVNTTPFSAGYQILWEFINWMTLTDADGNHYPMTWKTILRGVNTRQNWSVHYGVHGIDQDPRLNPLGSEGVACTPCDTDADCGAGGNFCLGYAGGAACGVACATDTACGEGARCARIWDDPDLFYLPKQCVRRDYVCR